MAFRPFAQLGHYSASKWAVRGLTHAYAAELAAHGITVNAYAPGIVDTAMWELIDAGLGRASSSPNTEGDDRSSRVHNKGDMLRRHSTNMIALGPGRTSTPEDVAGLVSFMAGPDSGYITGQTMVVDGGIVFT